MLVLCVRQTLWDVYMVSPESNYVGVLHNLHIHEIDVLTGKGVKMLLECLELYLSIYAASLH